MKTYIIESVAQIIDMIAIVIIIRGVIKGTIMFVKIEKNILLNKRQHKWLNAVRCNLASYFLLGLEFMIASDIIGAVIETNYIDLLHLGVLIIIRIVISYFLNRELTKTEFHEENTIL